MLALWLLAAISGATWVEITSGLRPNDDITAVGYGKHPDDIFVGTTRGFAYRSQDGGETYSLIFEPRDFDHHRRGSPLDEAASDPSRLPATISLIERCGDVLFLVTPATLWRSRDEGVSFDRLDVSPAGNGSEVWWVNCDGAKPGRLVINTPGGIFESNDWGDTFTPFRNPFPDGFTVNTANYRTNGLLIVQRGNQIYRERPPPAEGYDLICNYGRGDGIGSSSISWHWWTESHGEPVLYAVTDDGILLCNDGKISRYSNEQFGRRPASFIWIDWTREGHLFIASDRDVWETWDNGATFKQVFEAPTQRSIRRLTWNPERKDDLIVATGGQLFRRVPDEIAAKRRWVSDAERKRLRRTLEQAPLWRVVTTALERVELDPGQTAGQRLDTTLRALMPRLTVGVSRLEDTFGSRGYHALEYAGGDEPRTRDERTHGQTEWGAFVFWDLADVLYDEFVSSHKWANVDRLRQQLTYRIQDTWVMWAQATEAVAAPGLSQRQHLYHELKRREAAAYLHEMTGGVFEVFAPELPRRTAKE